MTFAILGILVLQKWGIPFATLSYFIMQKTLRVIEAYVNSLGVKEIIKRLKEEKDAI